jgi:hypothetical protein
MPSISIWALRLACVYLAVGLTAGALLLAHKGVSFLPHAQGWFSLHFHTMLFGWTIQFIMGVAYWILPTFGDRSTRTRDTLVIAALALVNAGTIVGSLAGLYGLSATAAFAMQALAAVAFAGHMWPRVKAFGA